MSIVTKIFIVLTLVCAIISSVFEVVTLGMAKQYKDALTAANDRAIASSQLYTLAQAQNTDWAARYESLRAKEATDLAAITRDNDNMRTTMVGLQSQGAQAQVQHIQDQAANLNQTAVIATMQAHETQIQKQLDDARPMVTELYKKNVELNQVNDTLTTKNEQAERAINHLKELLVDATKAASTSTGNVGGVKLESVGVASAVPINGKVTNVRTSNGETYLELSLGKRDNIDAGTRFIISRGDKYVGDAIVMQATPEASVAKVRTGNPIPVQVNDLVSSGPQ